MLGSKGAGKEAYEKWHEALRRLSKDSTIPPAKMTLGTHYPAEFEESSDPPEWADEYDGARKRSHVGLALIWLTALTAVGGLAAWKWIF